MPKEARGRAEVAAVARTGARPVPSASRHALWKCDVATRRTLLAPLRPATRARDDCFRLRSDRPESVPGRLHRDGSVDRLLVPGRGPVHPCRGVRRSQIRNMRGPDPGHRGESSSPEDSTGLQCPQPDRRKTARHSSPPRHRLPAAGRWSQRTGAPLAQKGILGVRVDARTILRLGTGDDRFDARQLVSRAHDLGLRSIASQLPTSEDVRSLLAIKALRLCFATAMAVSFPLSRALLGRAEWSSSKRYRRESRSASASNT